MMELIQYIQSLGSGWLDHLREIMNQSMTDANMGCVGWDGQSHPVDHWSVTAEGQCTLLTFDMMPATDVVDGMQWDGDPVLARLEIYRTFGVGLYGRMRPLNIKIDRLPFEQLPYVRRLLDLSEVTGKSLHGVLLQTPFDEVSGDHFVPVSIQHGLECPLDVLERIQVMLRVGQRLIVTNDDVTVE